MSPDRAGAGPSRWQEWVIALAIAALVVIGVAAIWGAPIRRWVQDLGADPGETPPGPPRTPAGAGL